MMTDTIDTLEAELNRLDEEIAEQKRRLPAHSVKPPTMMALLDLEDKREEVAARLARLKQGTHSKT